jgi:hypothetical protein
MSQNLFPRRYYIDEEGRRVLIGLTVEHTGEFELLEVTDSSNDVDRANLNLARWLELYRLHQDAWDIWRAKSSKDHLSRTVPDRPSLTTRPLI